MKTTPKSLATLALLSLTILAVRADDPSLTIYNQNFAVVRDTVPLDLTQGENTPPPFADITAQLEPDSVILRDPSGKVNIKILEQNYRNDPVSQDLLLSLFEGKTIDFLVKEEGKPDETIQGTVIRSGYVGRAQQDAGIQPGQPIIEVGEKMQFGLPGQPIFPSLGDDTILKPQLAWKLYADSASKFNAEIAYVTNGMNWQASYNIVEPEVKVSANDDGKIVDPQAELIDINGWITMNNECGKTFTNAKIKLIAGDVNRIQNQPRPMMRFAMAGAMSNAPEVTEKSFDEYHMYTLPLATTLHDGETKQVEFIHATGVKSQKIYIYDGVDMGQYGGWDPTNIRNNPDYGTQSTTKVHVVREFKNTADNNLGLPLPAGRVRFYKQDDTQLEFTGENMIDHTPKDELVKLYTGDSFDLVGERKRTDFHVDSANNNSDESFAIKLRNHKKEAVTIEVDEHLYRWSNATITKNSDPFEKADAQLIKFQIKLQPDEEKTITYTVHYSW